MVDLTPKESFHLEEFKALREEIALRIKDQVDVERQVALSVAAVYAFIVHLESGQSAALGPWLLWILPFVIVLFGFLRWHLDDRMIEKIAAHIKMLESEVFHVAGWEIRQADYKSRRRWGAVRWINVKVFWYVLLAATLLLATAQIYFGVERPAGPASWGW